MAVLATKILPTDMVKSYSNVVLGITSRKASLWFLQLPAYDNQSTNQQSRSTLGPINHHNLIGQNKMKPASVCEAKHKHAHMNEVERGGGGRLGWSTWSQQWARQKLKVAYVMGREEVFFLIL